MNEPDDADALTVLLVDDDLDVLGANARFLRIHGLAVVVADRAAVALERLGDGDIDVVVTDLRMPGEDGLVFAESARALDPFLPIVFFSGYAEVADVVRAMRLGAIDFLEKPVEPEALLSRLRSLAGARGHTAPPTSRAAFDLEDDALPFRARVLAYERHLIETSLARHDGRVAEVLASLKINRRTLNEKMRRLGIVRPPAGDDA